MEGFFFIFIFVVGFIIYIGKGLKWLSNTSVGSERWCEMCNTWNNMKLVEGKFICEKCSHPNVKDRGCPRCGWYARFENRYAGRVGPYSERVNYGSYLLVYRETWNCPKHGDYICVVSDAESRDYARYDA